MLAAMLGLNLGRLVLGHGGHGGLALGHGGLVLWELDLEVLVLEGLVLGRGGQALGGLALKELTLWELVLEGLVLGHGGFALGGLVLEGLVLEPIDKHRGKRIE